MTILKKLLAAGMPAGLANAMEADVGNNLTATGTSQTDALNVGYAIARFTTVASGTGAVLQANSVGDAVMVLNAGANPLNVYPPSGHSINALSSNAAASVPNTASIIFKRVTNTLWVTFNASPDAFNTVGSWISTDTAPSRFYRADNTFSGTVDHATFLGYNITGFGQISDASKSALMFGMEADYNDGSARYVEYHVDLAAPAGAFKRPFTSALAITGGNAGSITETSMLADINVSFYGQHVKVIAQASYTVGAQFHLYSLDTGGKDWLFLSSGSGAGLGAGVCALYDNTSGRYGWIVDTNGSIVAGDLAALSTTATDGFLYVPTCAGTPTGVPTAKTGKAPIVINTTNNKLYFYSGGAWRDAGP